VGGLVQAVEQSFARRFPKKRPHGGGSGVVRVLLALELLKHELGASDEDICQRLRTDVAVMYACGLRAIQADRSQAHFVCRDPGPVRHRIDTELMDELVASKRLSPWKKARQSGHLLVDTFPSEQGSQRVTDATTLYKAQKKSYDSSSRSRAKARHQPGLESASPGAEPSLQKILRRFGRQCRGQGKVFVTLVRETERHLLALGTPIEPGASKPEHACITTAGGVQPSERLLRDLDATSAAIGTSHTIAAPHQGKKLAQCKIVNAYDPPLPHPQR